MKHRRKFEKDPLDKIENDQGNVEIGVAPSNSKI